MRCHLQLYNHPATAKRYTVTEICQLVDNGLVMAKSLPDRKRMKQILKNNIEAQQGYALKHLGAQKQHYLKEAQRLTKYRNSISWKP